MFYDSVKDSKDIYGEILGIPNAKVVITAKDLYYNNSGIQDLIGGKFKVFGRITNILTENSVDYIDLLANTKTPMSLRHRLN